MKKFGVIVILICLCELAWSHGDLHQRILNISKRIDEYPGDLELYQERGELYLKHQDHRHAIRDLTVCMRALGPSNRLNYSLALAYFGIGRPRKTIRLLFSMPDVNQRDPKVYRLLARAFLEVGKEHVSAEYFQKVLHHSIRPRPENYLELATVYGLMHDPKQQWVTLENGINRLGFVPSLTQQLLKLFIQHAQFDHAIFLQTKIVEGSLRKEFALVDRAKIYQAMNNFREAASDLKQAHGALQSRPAHVQSRSANLTLMSEIMKLQKSERYEQ